MASFLTNPIVAVVLFNAVMVLWHIPVIFDWASWHGWVMNWLMAPSFVIVGLLFWRVILPSHPWPARGSTRVQIGAIVVTAFEMLVLAMAMSIFTKAPVVLHERGDGRSGRGLAGSTLGGGHPVGLRRLLGRAGTGAHRHADLSAPAGGVSASFERVLGRA